MNKFSHHLENIRTTQQLLSSGETKHTIHEKVRKNELVRIRDGIYVFGDYLAQLPRWERTMLDAAAYFRRHPHAVFSHTTAAQILNLPVPQQQPVHVYIGKNSDAQNSHKTLQKIQKHCLLTGDTAITLTEDRVKITSPLQTVSDCVRILTAPYGLALADSALYQGLVEHSSLRLALLESKGRHCRKMRRLVQYLSPLSESPGESHTRWILIEMELDFIEQAEIYADGKYYRVDFLLDKYGIIIEFDGHLKMTDFGPAEEAVAQERLRERALQNLGYLVFRADWELITRRPNEFRAQLNTLLRMRRAPTFMPSSYLQR